ncbi:MAG: YihY/virulence factor BrkB family protein [Steroidobacteraceae bacterium]
MWPQLQGAIDRWLFGPASEQSTLLARLRRLLRFPYAILRDLLGGQLSLHAMGLVYATLLAVVPLVAFSFAILKAFGAHRELEPLIYEFFRPMGDGATELTRRVMEFADRVRGGLVGSVGLALLLWTLIDTMKKVENSFNFVWRVEQPRSFARRFAEYLSLLVIAPLLVAGVIGLSQLALRSSSVQLITRLPLLDTLWALILVLAPVVLAAALLTVLYRFIPNTHVRYGPAVAGGLTAGVLWAAIGSVFATFVSASARLTIVYAGFAIIIAALIWTYFGWLILLLGAQVSFYVQNPSYLRLGLRQLQLSNAETERLALAIMYLVARGHTHGRERWDDDLLAARLQVPGVAVTRMARALEQAGLLVNTEEQQLLPARDASHIALADILQVARGQLDGPIPHRSAPVERVDAFLGGLEQAWRSHCEGRSLRDLLEDAPQPPAIVNS